MSTNNHGRLGDNGTFGSPESVQAYWNDDHPIPQQPLARTNRSNSNVHIRQPLDQDIIVDEDPTQGQQILSAQYALRHSYDQTNKLTREEEDELDDLKRHRDRENEELAKQKEVAQRAQRRLERTEERIRQRLQRSQVLRPSNSSYTNQQPRPLPIVTTTTPRLATTSSLGKRNVGESQGDKDENGLERDGRRSKKRPNVSQTEEYSSLLNTVTKHSARGTETLGPRTRHPHPSALRRPSSRSEALTRLPSSVGLDPLQSPNSTAGDTNWPHQYGHLAQAIGDDEGLLGRNPPKVQNVGCQHTAPPVYGQSSQNWTDTALITGQRPHGISSNEMRNNQLSFPRPVSQQPSQSSASLRNGIYPSEHTKNATSTAMPNQHPGQPRGNPFLTGSSPRNRCRSNSDAIEGGYGSQNEGGKIGQSPTKRQKKRQAMLDSGKAIPKDSEKVKGVVTHDKDDNLLHLFHGEWVPAAYHHERRLALLAREDLKGAYTYPPKQGMTEDDRMAFHPDYSDIDMSVRHRRPHLLYQWKAPGKLHPYEEPNLMRDPDDGKLLLGQNNHPILDWPELPKTISAQVEGFWIEYWWRLNRNIRIEDVLARCPTHTKKSVNSSYRGLAGISAFGNRRERDRLATGTCSWEQKEGSRTIRAQYERIMPNRVMAEIAHNNTTTWFRDLSNKEIRSICHANKGKGTALSRAGNRTLNEDDKMKVDSRKDPELEATYSRLLQEKHDADAHDPYYGQEQPPNPGFAFRDSGAGRAQYGGATEVGSKHSVNTQNLSPQSDDAGHDTTLFESPLNSTTLVEDQPPQHGSSQSVAPSQLHIHQARPKEATSILSQKPGWYSHWDGRMTQATKSSDLERTYEISDTAINNRLETTQENCSYSSQHRSLGPEQHGPSNVHDLSVQDVGNFANLLQNTTGAATDLQTPTRSAGAPLGYVAATEVSKAHASESDLWTGSQKRLLEQHYGLQDQTAGSTMLSQNQNDTLDPANDDDDTSNDLDSLMSQFINQGESVKWEAQEENAEEGGNLIGKHEDAPGEGLEFDANAFGPDLFHTDGLQLINEDAAQSGPLDYDQYDETFSNPVE
ncbi:MAG: hypothetical protein Q9209_002981 [Squamulea sp. 1 TL-2023]